MVPDLQEGGIGGTSVDAEALFNVLNCFQPTTVILVPLLLKVMVETMEARAAITSPSLRFAEVGGAPVAPCPLHRGRALGLPVYQGYGLSETGSVVSLNLPGANKEASVGRPLPHVQARIADDGEIAVRGALFLGYLEHPANRPEEWRTGDLGHLDGDGFLYVTGRKKSAFATAFGRNVCPEWVAERADQRPAHCPGGRIRRKPPLQCGRPGPLLRWRRPQRRLPDYARIGRWVVADQPFSPRNGLANGIGALNRPDPETRYAALLARCYEAGACYDVF